MYGGLAFLLPVDTSLWPVLSATVPQLYSPQDNLQICDRPDFSSALETDDNRSAISFHYYKHRVASLHKKLNVIQTYFLTDPQR